MKKEEMVSVLAIAGAEPRIIDAMAEAYDIGYEEAKQEIQKDSKEEE